MLGKTQYEFWKELIKAYLTPENESSTDMQRKYTVLYTCNFNLFSKQHTLRTEY